MQVAHWLLPPFPLWYSSLYNKARRLPGLLDLGVRLVLVAAVSAGCWGMFLSRAQSA